MRKKISAILTMLSVIGFWSLPLGSQTIDISGQVINGTQNNVGVADLQVELHLYQGTQENSEGLRKTVTDSEGFFRFSALPSKPDVAYSPIVRYLEVDYPGPYIDPSKSENIEDLKIAVYDTTTSPEDVGIDFEHLIVEAGEGMLKINEMLVLKNRGNKTYIGQKEISPGQRDALAFTLPQNAMDVQIGQGLMSCCVVMAKGKLYNTMPFPPGAKQVSYVYYLKYDASQFAFDKLFDYNAEAFDLLVRPPGIRVTGSSLKPVKDLQIGGESYQRYSVKGLKKQQLLKIELSNLPRGRRNLRWPLTVVVALGLLFVVAYSLSKRRKNHGVTEEETVKDAQLNAKEELLRAIADLDDRYEHGHVPKTDYERARSELKSKLKNLMASMGWKEEA